MENLTFLQTECNSKNELLELRNLHESIKNLVNKDFLHISKKYSKHLQTSINIMEKLIEYDLETFAENE